MSGVMRNSATAAKLKCMRSEMLGYDDYKKMSDCSSVAEAAAYLKSNTAYSPYLKDIDVNRVHRENLEIRLKTALLDDFAKLYCFADSDLRGFLSKILMFHEAEAINKVARSIYTHSRADDELSSFLKKHLDVNIELLSKAEDLNGFVESLNNTQYYRPLMHVAKNRKQLNVFDIETALNIYCYTSISRYIAREISKPEKETVNMFYGALIDICNLRSIYRCKTNFKLESEYIYSYIIPYNYKVKKEEIISMANSESFEELKQLILSTPYGSIFADGLSEKSVDEYMFGLSKKFLKLFPYNYVSLTSYFRIKETEIKNIFSVIEGLRYSLPPNEIMSFVVV